MAEVVVVDASPLIFLGNIGRLDLLRAAGGSRFVVPQAVFDEVTASTHRDAATRAVESASWIERLPPLAIPATVDAWDLGPGESAVLAAASSMAAAVVLDDLAGRRAARALELEVMGTLGLVIQASRSGVIDDPRAMLFELKAAGMWLSDGVIERTLALAGA